MDTRRGENWGGLAQKLTLRLERADHEALARFARRKGVGPSTLARIWIKEHLREEERAETDVS